MIIYLKDGLFVDTGTSITKTELIENIQTHGYIEVVDKNTGKNKIIFQTAIKYVDLK